MFRCLRLDLNSSLVRAPKHLVTMLVIKRGKLQLTRQAFRPRA